MDEKDEVILNLSRALALRAESGSEWVEKKKIILSRISEYFGYEGITAEIQNFLRSLYNEIEELK